MSRVTSDLRLLRYKRGLSCEEIAVSARCSAEAVRRYEAGEALAPKRIAARIAVALGISLAEYCRLNGLAVEQRQKAGVA